MTNIDLQNVLVCIVKPLSARCSFNLRLFERNLKKNIIIKSKINFDNCVFLFQ